MKILSIGAATPSLIHTNDERVEMMLQANGHLSEIALKRVRRTAKALLSMSGAKERRLCGPGESGWTLGLSAGKQAIERANIDPATIDVIISGGVGRGFLEPSTASAFGEVLGASRSVAFDVAEACMGWLRAVQIAHHFLHAGTYRRALILNIEVNSIYQSLEMQDPEQEISYMLPQLTIGDAVTATVLEVDDAPWPLWFRSALGGHDLCRLPLPRYESWQPDDGPKMQPLRFYCHFQKMNEFTFRTLGGLYKEFLDGELRARGLPIDRVFTHASEQTGWQRWAERSGLADQFYSIFPRYGNVVSAAVPLAIHDAETNGTIQRGQGVYVCVASSGMGVGNTYFKY